MKSSTNVRRKGGAAQPTSFKLGPIAAGCVVMMLVASAAHAQQSDGGQPAGAEKKDDATAQTKLNSVVVTGIRRGIENAIAVKKDSDSIVEVISAEDIGKLPDTSIAESIARLPGLTAQRVNGRAQEIQIRGLSGQFAGTTLNGREQVSTGDNRAVEFDQYPSELLSAVLVYKTPDASLIGQGLSGTVDLQTVRPLSFGGRTVSVGLRGERNSLGSLNAGGASANGSRFSVSYIDQFADRTVGVAVGFARLRSPNQNQYYRNWGYPSGSGTINGTAYNDVRVPGGVQVRAESASQDRDGLMAVLEYKPSKNFSSLIDFYHSKFERVALQRGFEAGLAFSSATLTNPVVTGATPVAGVPNTFTGGVLTDASYVGVKPVLRHDLNERKDTINAFGWTNKLLIDQWTATADLSYSKATRRESILELYSGTVPKSPGATDTFDVSLPSGGGVPSIRAGLNYADPNIIKLVDSGGWGQDGYLKKPKVTDELKSFRLGGKRDMELGIFNRLDVGVNYTEREKTRNVPEGFLRLKTSPTTVPANLITTPTSLAFIGIPGVLSYDPKAAYNEFYNFDQQINQKDVLNKIWGVKEKITTVYGKLDVDTTLASVPVRGNAGVQVVKADQKSTAFNVDAANVANRQEYTTGSEYTDVLPSVNLAFSFPSDQIVRFGLAKQVARPRMDDLRATRVVDVSVGQATTGEWSGDGGNPKLKPWRAKALDISYEKYFAKKGYISLSGFYKKLDTYIYKQKIPYDFTGITPPAGKPLPASPIGLFEQPANGSGGSLKGLEFALSVPGSLFAPALDGFGTVLSLTTNSSAIKPFGPADTRPLPGLSKNTANLTLYYEKDGFQTRVAVRNRSKFVGEITGFGADREFTFVKPERVVDFQIGYEFQEGQAKGLSLQLQVNNLTNSVYETYYNNDPTQVRESVRYGRTILLGGTYKF